MAAVKPIPESYHTVTPYLIVSGADKFIDFLKHAFGAEESARFPLPDGTLMHADVRLGDSMIMLADAMGDMQAMPTCLYLYVEDTDDIYRRALEAGATSVQEPADQFFGDRNAGVQDPFGNYWWIGTHKEDVPLEELKRRAEAFAAEYARRAGA